MTQPYPLFIAGGGEMGERMRAVDWSTTALGPVETWPQSLKAALGICISSRFPIAIYWGPDLVLLYNDAWSPILGEKHPRSLGRPAREVWPEIWDTIGPMFEQVMTRGEATYADDSLLLMHRHGYTEECYFNFTFTPVRGEGTRVEGVFNAVVETTYRVLDVRRTRALRDLGERTARASSKQELAELAVESLALAPYDAPFCLLYLVEERGMARLVAKSGVTPGPAAPATLSLLGSEDEPAWPLARAYRSRRIEVVDGLRDRFAGSLSGGPWPESPSSAFAAPIVTPSAEHPSAFLIVGASPRRAIDGEYTRFVETAASQLAASFASAQRRDELAEIDRAKTVFFSNVSHEFRTPLTLMLGPLEDAIASPEHALRGDDLDTAHRNAVRLQKLVNALLDFSRIEAGRMQAAYEKTDLAAFTAELASVFRSAVERAGLRFIVETSAPAVPTYVDRDMWEKIVLNLLSNALKFTLEGEIEVTLRGEREAAVLRVRDTGTGVPAAELPHLFERFHRIRNERARTHEGSGIGLALVSELVKLHGGTIHVESVEGKGTTFEVRIPGGDAHLPGDRVVAQHARPRGPAAAAAFVAEALRWVPGSSPSPLTTGAEPIRSTPTDITRPRERIVLADDNADMREYVARLLGAHWRVEAVSDGQAALEAARRERPALIISDVMMPKLDGFGLLRELRADTATSTIPVILLSARAGEEATTEGLQAGASDYLVKPFSARELLARVSAQIAIAKEREAERARLLSLLEQVPAIVNVLRGPELSWAFVHPRALAGMQKTRDILGRPLLEIVPEMREQPFYERLRRVYETGERFTQHEALAWHVIDGRRVERYWTSVYQPVRDASGAIEGVMTFDLDVTEQVRARQEVERASRAKDEFLATLSHELRTPLNAVLGWASILRSVQRDAAKLDHGLAVIERNAQLQARLVSDLLDVSRIITGKLRLNLKKTSAAVPIHAAVDVVRPAAEARGVRLLVELDPDLGSTVADPERLQQVVWNLLSNAVRFTPRLGSVTVKGRRTSSSLVIEVVDTGAGIAREHLPHIFERFRQVDSSTTRAHGGLGLGLAIVRHLVEAHGGQVTAASDGPDRGATFTVVLPIRAVAAAETGETAEAAESVETSEPPAMAEGALKGVRTLLVDDEPDSLELVRVVLEGAGAQVVTATSAKAALSARGPFDVIISDIGMPEMDGYAFMREIRSRDTDAMTPGIALTAYARPEDADRALRSGYQQHLAKPIEAERLIAAVEMWSMRRRPLDV